MQGEGINEAFKMKQGEHYEFDGTENSFPILDTSLSHSTLPAILDTLANRCLERVRHDRR